jgi:hypothetical protein
VTYSNTGTNATTGQAKLSITGDVTVIDAAAFISVANTSNWVPPLALETGATSSQLIYMKLPETGSSNIRLQIQTDSSPGCETRFEKS